MKRLSLLGFAGVLATLLAGCPIYDDNNTTEPCDGSCNNPVITGCKSSSDCGINETCGSDSQCHVGDCTLWGCANGGKCTVGADHTASCNAPGGGTGTVYCGNPKDCAATETCAPDGTCKPGSCDQTTDASQKLGCIYGYVCTGGGADAACKPSNPAACGTDEECTALGAGDKCVSGICTAPADQCFDQTQCAAGDKCVSGKCTPSCVADKDCPASYTCDTGRGICSKPAHPCSITNDCGGPDAVCVAGACVPRSKGATCPAGTVWVENGCIPNQSSNFVCTVDGQQDVCKAGSICLHHSCYISCEAPNQNACSTQPSSLNQCKTVTSSSGKHQVCGSSDNLGSECAPATSCAEAKICIDGFCK